MRGISQASLLMLIGLGAVVMVGVVRCGARSGANTGEVPDIGAGSAHPRPVATGFEGCPPEGDGGDARLNVLKNRTDTAAAALTPANTVLALGWPAGVERRRRTEWSAADDRAVSRNEGIPVAVEGYFAGAKQEGPESPNCHGAAAEFRDWHLWLGDAPGTDRTHAIVVETTPVIRARHPEWSLAAIRKLARDGTRVRVSGWLLLDQEHPEQLGRTRGTLWEIHPIDAIDVWRNDAAAEGGEWLPLTPSAVATDSARVRRHASSRSPRARRAR